MVEKEEGKQRQKEKERNGKQISVCEKLNGKKERRRKYSNNVCLKIKELKYKTKA